MINTEKLEIAALLEKRKPQLAAKRLMDIAISGCALLVIWPVLVLIAAAIVIDDPGPVFYRQVRVGRNGKTFRIFKFRTMIVDADKKGLAITVGRDSRITRVGAFLRRTKLDELAQLINVFCGEMSFVGPRPEVQKYVDLYTPYQRQVLLVRPGITDYASIAYRNENDLLAGTDDPEKMYIEEIMPAKIELNMKYLREISPLADIRLILSTIAVVVKD
ncbi:MAG: sugar transferase [Clostridia bacterium]|nr:sugar transferase [Clostridia bacterium]